MTSAAKVGQNPSPKPYRSDNGNSSARYRQRLGTARPTLTIDCAKSPPRRRRPSHIAGGSAITAATSTATAEMRRCSTVRCTMPVVPCQCSAWRHEIQEGADHRRARFHGVARRARPPRERVEHHRHDHAEAPAHHDLGAEVTRQARVDERAVAALPMSPVTVTRPTVVTVAMRRPATMAGAARGRSTVMKRRNGRTPIPSAASTTAGATLSTPSTMFRRKIASV